LSQDLLRFLTCGSVDDGKSTLIGRLLHDSQAIYEDQLASVTRDSARFGTTGEGTVDLALLTDGLKAEREQGITIDVAYRYFSTDRRKFIIADTPGHEQYTRNMATGASRCQCAIILVDARRGVLTQTRRHSFIARLLGIDHFVVAINKMDLVNYAPEVFERIRTEYAAFAAGLDIPDVRFIPISALQGDNVVIKSDHMSWYLGPPLLTCLETIPIAGPDAAAGLRLPIQYVIRPTLDFRGLAGTIASGRLQTGEEIVALPSGRRSRVKAIVTYEGERESAVAPMAVTVTLEDEIDVSRGDWFADPVHPPRATRNIEASLCWLSSELLDARAVAAARFVLKHTARSVKAKLLSLNYRVDINTLERQAAPAGLAMNDIACVGLSLAQPLFVDPYVLNRATGSFILIDEVTNQTVAAGMIE